MEINQACLRLGEIVNPAAISRSLFLLYFYCISFCYFTQRPAAAGISTLFLLYFLVQTSYNNLELHLQPQQEINTSLRIVEVFHHQLSPCSSRYKVAEGVAIGLVHLIEDVIDQ